MSEDEIVERVIEAGRPDAQPSYEEEVDEHGSKTGRWRTHGDKWYPVPMPPLGKLQSAEDTDHN